MAAPKKLTLFDVTNLVVGAIVGADIYVAASFGSGLLGPASLLSWVVAGIFATIIALVFAKCSGVVKEAGGPYAYAKEAFGHFSGFITGWALWLAEVAALCVFPVAFVTYFSFFFPLEFIGRTIMVLLFVLFLFLTNYFGVKKAARTNDAFTILKIAPLFLLIIAGFVWIAAHPSMAASNLSPFAPLGFENFGMATVLIFWAYVGFELASIPVKDIKNAEKTIPKAIVFGMLIVSVFYILTNFVIISSANYIQLAGQSAPLTFVALILMGGLGAVIMGIGAMISVSGSDESGLIGTTRLAYSMAADGYFPKFLGSLHKKYSTPHTSLAVHSLIAFIAAAFLPIKDLITFSVFTFCFCFIMVSLSALRLRKDLTTKALSLSSIVICFYLISQSGLSSIVLGLVMLAIGIPVYFFFAPKTEFSEAKKFLSKEDNILKHRIEKENVFLARLLRHLKERSRTRKRKVSGEKKNRNSRKKVKD